MAIDVHFEFEIDRKVITPFGDTGIVRSVSLDDTNEKKYWVMRNADPQWFKETDLKPA